MKAKKVGVAFLIGSILLAFILAARLLQMGRNPSDVFVSTMVFLILLVIPIIGTMRSLRAKELGLRSDAKRTLLVLRIIVLFVIAPLVGGLIYYVTYPSVSLAMPLAVAVLVGASLFFFFAK